MNNFAVMVFISLLWGLLVALVFTPLLGLTAVQMLIISALGGAIIGLIFRS